MASKKSNDVVLYNRLYRGNSDNDGSSYLMHADQVEDLQKGYYKVAEGSIGATNNHTIKISTTPPEVGSMTGGVVGDIIIVVAD